MRQARFPGGGRGRQGEFFEYEWVGRVARVIRPRYEFDRRTFEKAVGHFKGRADVLGAFDDRIAAKEPTSFGAWLRSQGLSPRHHACYIAGILCEEWQVTAGLRGSHDKVVLSFPSESVQEAVQAASDRHQLEPKGGGSGDKPGVHASGDPILLCGSDDEFIRWCHDNPGGFVWTCRRNQDGEVTHVDTLHSATINGDLCPHFKNKNRPGGYEVNLTTKRRVKVCSTDRRRLEDWAKPYRGAHKMCSACISLP